MRQTKHIGKHENQKVVIVYREIPGLEDMCLVAYSDKLPRMYHDELMKVIDGAPAQQAKDPSEVMFRTLMADGRSLLQTLHTEGHLRKVSTNTVTITPTPNSSVRLDELNRLIKELAKGDEARKRMAQLDAQQGLYDPAKNIPTVSNEQLAEDRKKQSNKMRAEAMALIAEADRLTKESEELAKNGQETPSS